jgi:double zinc ribbon protein
MSRLRRELAVVPVAGVVIAALIALVASVMFGFVALGFPPALRTGFAALMALFVFLYGFLVCYVYGDAKRRGMRHRVWAAVAALVPNGLGFLAYFLLREPQLRRCGACGAAARRELAFCPQCGSALAGVCPACRRPVEAGWSHCAHCGANMAGSAATATP